MSAKQTSLIEKITALFTALIGLVVFFAPLLLLNVAPALASTATIQTCLPACVTVPTNQVYGILIVIGGIALYAYAVRRRR